MRIIQLVGATKNDFTKLGEEGGGIMEKGKGEMDGRKVNKKGRTMRNKEEIEILERIKKG